MRYKWKTYEYNRLKYTNINLNKVLLIAPTHMFQIHLDATEVPK